MIKDILKENEGKKPNSREMAVLKEHFGDCFNSDDTFDFEKFRAKLGEEVAISNEGYELNFLGKNYARLLTAVDTTTVVVPDEEHNSKPENAKSENVYISGDNLDALKHLLKSYARRVKCIYIDPPYNTGSDGFVYKDKFNFSAAEIEEKLNLDEEKAQRILDFSKRGSASHSAWLMFMYPRLQLAHDLLADDGVLFISIDDNELANLRLLCDSVFREENFLAILARRTKSGGGSATDDFAVEHDYVMVYARKQSCLSKLAIPFDEEYLKRYDHEDEHGRYFWDTMERSSTKTKPYIIEAPDGTPLKGKWFRSEDTFKKDLKTGEVKFLKKKDGTWSVQFKQRLGVGKNLRSLITEDMHLDLVDDEYKSYSDDLEILGLGGLFSYPKTVCLVKYLLQVIKGNEIIVDFFSGSATTAESVMRLNLERVKNGSQGLRYIMVQLPEDLDAAVLNCNGDSKVVCQNAISFLDSIGRGHTLDEIGIERIKRAANRLVTESEISAKCVDLGFKHYTLKEPTEAQIEKILTFDPNAALVGTNDILKEFGKPTVLATWLVRDGYGLTDSPKEVVLDGYTAYWKDKHLYFIDAGFTETGLVQLMEKYESDADFNPTNVVIFGYGGMPWSVRQGLETNLAKLNPNNNSIGAKKLPIVIDVRY